MDIRLRNIINATYRTVVKYFRKIGDSTISVLRAIFLTSIRVANVSGHYSDFRCKDRCCILANGPSLKTVLSEGQSFDDSDIFCVNDFFRSEYFWTLKPKFYFICDGAYFNPSCDLDHIIVDDFIRAFSQVDWEIKLCIPSRCVHGGVISGLNNKKVTILRWNYSAFYGFTSLAHFVYKHRLGMPQCQTVANFALVIAINMGYKFVYLYGADHSWTKDLRVDDNNVVCYGDRHVYNTELQEIKMDMTLATLLRAYAAMFESHMAIEEYAREMGCKIYNCTKGSFVDAYERLY